MKFSTVSYIKDRRIENLRKKIGREFKTKSSINQWGLHLTIGSGVKVPNAQLKNFVKELNELSNNVKSFNIRLNGFGFMEDFKGEVKNPYVVYVKIDRNKKLINLHHKIEMILKKYSQWYIIENYDPHVTLAYDDLTEANFERLKKEFKGKNIILSYKIDSFCLAVHGSRHGKRDKYKEFILKK